MPSMAGSESAIDANCGTYSHNQSYRIPYAIAQSMPGKLSRVAAVIYSYSNQRKINAVCSLTYDGIAECGGVSRSTVTRAIKVMREMDGFEECDRHGRKRYTLHISGRCLRRYRCLFEQKFTMPDGVRCLTAIEEEIISILISHSTNPKARRGFEGSAGRFAQLTGRNADTVGKALRRLLAAGLIHRPRRGTSRHRLSQYTVCRDLRLIASKEGVAERDETNKQPRRQLTPQLTQQEIDHNARTERDRHYAGVREHVIAIVDAARARALQDEDYARISRELRSLDPQIVRAELQGDQETCAALRRRKVALAVGQSRALARIGMTMQDLLPQWTCKRCEDTGWRKDGRMCDCYSPPKRQ